MDIVHFVEMAFNNSYRARFQCDILRFSLDCQRPKFDFFQKQPFKWLFSSSFLRNLSVHEKARQSNAHYAKCIQQSSSFGSGVWQMRKQQKAFVPQYAYTSTPAMVWERNIPMGRLHIYTYMICIDIYIYFGLTHSNARHFVWLWIMRNACPVQLMAHMKRNEFVASENENDLMNTHGKQWASWKMKT